MPRPAKPQEVVVDLLAAHRRIGQHRRALDRAVRNLADCVNAIDTACGIIERADARLLALDGPCGNQPPAMTLKEWRALYRTLDNVRKEK